MRRLFRTSLKGRPALRELIDGALAPWLDAEKATAEYKNGVLILTLPKKEEAKPKTIKIEAAKN